MAPELSDDNEYNEKVDIYSFALMVYEVVVGRPVFPRTLALGYLTPKVLNGERAEIPGSVEDILEDLIQRGSVPGRERTSVVCGNLLQTQAE
jgi:serine/threonine protein kinase